MTAKEMHIKFGLGFQKLGANSRRKIYDPEIDVLLNQEFGKYIVDHIKPKPRGFSFQTDQEATDSLRPLIVRDYPLVPYLTKSTTKLRVYSMTLPVDYGYLLNHKASLSCTLSDPTTKQLRVAAFSIPDSTKNSSPYYQTFTIKARGTGGDTTLVDFSTLTNWTGLPNKADKFSFLHLITELLSTTDYAIYYENYAGTHYANKLVIVYSGTVSKDSIVVGIDGTEIVTAFTSINRQVTLGNVDYDSTPREEKAAAIDQLINMPFYKPSKTEPLSLLYGNQLDIFVHPSTIVSSVQITYLKQPEKIDVSLSRNCPLDDTYCDQLVSRAVEFAGGTVGQPDLYSFKTRDNISNKPTP